MNDFCHHHNLVGSENIDADKRFGIKVSLPPGDPLTDLLGKNWETVHWYATELERDQAFDDMAGRHVYSRDSDTASQVLEKISR